MRLKKLSLSTMVLIALLVLWCNSISAASNTYVTDDFVYNSETNEIVGYAGNSDRVVIPENAVVGKGFKFTSRGLDSAKSDSAVKVSTLILSKGVTVKGDLNLTSYDGFRVVEFYNTAEEMPNVTFFFAGNEKLKKLRLPEGLTEIESGMCAGCTALSDLYIPDSVEKISNRAFQYCKNIDELILPKSLADIGENAFESCNGIKKIFVPSKVDYKSLYIPYTLESAEFETEPRYTADFYRAFIRTKWFENEVIPTIKDDFIFADGSLFRYVGKNKNVVIPTGIEVIEVHAFGDSDIENVTLPNTLKKISENAFGLCSKLEKIVIPESVEEIGFAAFSECYSLKSVTIEGSPIMDDNVFEWCYSLEDEGITINGNIRYIVSITGEKSNPFAFTNTSYNQGTGLDMADIQTTDKPEATRKPEATHEPTPTLKPEATAEPKETPLPSETSEPSNISETLYIKGGTDLAISLNDKAVLFPDAQPFIDSKNRTQIPIRAVAEMLDCTVEWDGESKTTEITHKDGRIVQFTINSDIMTNNGKSVQMDTVAMIKDDRTYIPVRFVAEAMGLTVEWKE